MEVPETLFDNFVGDVFIITSRGGDSGDGVFLVVAAGESDAVQNVVRNFERIGDFLSF